MGKPAVVFQIDVIPWGVGDSLMAIRSISKACVFAVFACIGVTACVPVCAARESARKAAPARCGDEKTQSGYFLSIIRDIALNGDLTDPKPLQTILETKFDAHPVTEGEQAGHRTNYASYSMFGRPAEVTYAVLDDPALQRKAGLVASLRIQLGASWAAIPPKDVENCFADLGDRPVRRPTADGTGSSWSKPIPRVPETGGRIRVTWSDAGNQNRVDTIGILLSP